MDDVQAALQRLGFDLSATGEYDAATEAAVKSFQTAHGLAADGVVGPATRRVLFGLGS